MVKSNLDYDHTFVYKGQMPSGKNRIKKVFVRGRMIMYPEKRFKIWRADFQAQLAAQLAQKAWSAALYPKGTTVAFAVDYWPGDRITRDLTGILDAMFHATALKNGGFVVEDDGQYKWVDRYAEHELRRGAPEFQMHLRRHGGA